MVKCWYSCVTMFHSHRYRGTYVCNGVKGAPTAMVICLTVIEISGLFT